MANHIRPDTSSTDPTGPWARGTTLLHLVECKVRQKVYESRYWKKECLDLTEAEVLDKAMELNHIGGLFGRDCRNPTPFLCLVVRMLKVRYEKGYAIELIRNPDYVYPRVLGAFYLRLTGTDADMCQYIEPLKLNCQKLRRKLPDGTLALTRVDEVVDELLTKDYSCDIALPRTLRRWTLKSLLGLEILPRENTSGNAVVEEEGTNREENDQDRQQLDEMLVRSIEHAVRIRMERNRCPFFHAYRGHPHHGRGRDDGHHGRGRV